MRRDGVVILDDCNPARDAVSTEGVGDAPKELGAWNG